MTKWLQDILKSSNSNHCAFVCTLGGALVSQLWKMLGKRPSRSVSSWAKLWDPPCWSERRRRRSGGARMRRMRAGTNAPLPFFTSHSCPRLPPSHGCLCPSASETAAGRNSDHISHRLMRKRFNVQRFLNWFLTNLVFSSAASCFVLFLSAACGTPFLLLSRLKADWLWSIKANWKHFGPATHKMIES